MKLTKLQRYTTYCILLEKIKSEKCIICCSTFYRITEDDSWRRLHQILPELFSKRTQPVISAFSFWFANTKESIEALRQCIIETHP